MLCDVRTPPPESIHPAIQSLASAPSQSLSVEQDKGLQFLRDVSLVFQAMLNDNPGGEALQRGVVYGLDDIPGQLLLIQEVTGGLLEGVSAVKVSPTGNEQVHDVRVTV